MARPQTAARHPSPNQRAHQPRQRLREMRRTTRQMRRPSFIALGSPKKRAHQHQQPGLALRRLPYPPAPKQPNHVLRPQNTNMENPASHTRRNTTQRQTKPNRHKPATRKTSTRQIRQTPPLGTPTQTRNQNPTGLQLASGPPGRHHPDRLRE